jgi:hypothetical protein
MESDHRARKYADVEVGEEKRPENGEFWPGREKNVVSWFILVNGFAVGWNENVSRGWSYPVFNMNRKAARP